MYHIPAHLVYKEKHIILSILTLVSSSSNLQKSSSLISYLFVSVFKRQSRPCHFLQEVLPLFLVLIRRDEDDLQFVLVLWWFLKLAVKLAEAGVELLAGTVQTAAEVEPEQRQLTAQRVNIQLGFLPVDEALSEQIHQKLRHRCWAIQSDWFWSASFVQIEWNEIRGDRWRSAGPAAQFWPWWSRRVGSEDSGRGLCHCERCAGMRSGYIDWRSVTMQRRAVMFYWHLLEKWRNCTEKQTRYHGNGVLYCSKATATSSLFVYFLF